MAEVNLKCSYPNQCIGMDNHAHGSHMGFALRGSPHPEARKRVVLLNFCPWCGADLREWLAAYQADIDSHKLLLAAE